MAHVDIFDKPQSALGPEFVEQSVCYCGVAMNCSRTLNKVQHCLRGLAWGMALAGGLVGSISPAQSVEHGALESTAMDTVIVPLPKSEKDRRYLFDRALITLAMDKTVTTDGPYVVRSADIIMTKPRIRDRLLRGREVNVWRAAADKELEDMFLPIRIPVLKGLLGYRVSIIRKDNQAHFAAIRTLDELLLYSVGHGQNWADTKILEKAGFNVVSGQDYEGLFGMLALGRFDHFPRGVNEIVPEVSARTDNYPELSIEQTMMLHYTYPSYFYVSPATPKLKDRLQRGMWIAVEDGSHDQLITQHFGRDIAALNLGERKVFSVSNASLPDSVPLDDDRLWYQIEVNE